ncbi:putative integral membrane protein [Theileria parva strain Muguga]|uniref:THO complex subunit 2 N-terminal domain-containing protein n=1 Tax=Theileria parva TaxID=5875 RepID=Q4N3V3_THEPA|nr:putative integral membrane protein [Theileria parva strain Muguga]EAN33170.1 putative integral membrane protein [Theileria parva strain Muguga]|eukprot:XP_765453.1 hypothetical protein [Theileria parva strain Muguga]
MEKGKPRIKRKSIDESEKEEPEKVKQKLQKEPLKNSKRKLDTDSRDEHLRSLTLEGRRRSGSLDLSEVSKSSRNPSEERELEGSSTYTEQKRVNHGYTHTSGSYEHKNTRLVESKTNSNESRASRTLSSEPKRGEFYRNVQSPRADQKVLEMLENFEDETDLTLFKFVSSVANGTINPVTSVDALRTKFHGVCKNSTLVFKVLDVVSFFLDDPKKKQNLLPFLESLESFGLVSSMEIISVIDPAKLDSCNYSEGLVKISIRERTKNNYVLKIYNLFRENYHGYTALSNYLSSLVDKHGRNGFRFDVVQKSNKKQSTQNRVKELDPDTVVTMVNKISGMHKLCPMRTLYEVLKWLVLNNHSDEFVMKVLKSYPSKKVSYVVLLYLRNNYQNKDSLISRLGKEGNSSEKEKSDKEKPDKEKTSDKEVNLAGYSNDNIYKISGLMVSEKLLDVSEVYNYLDPSDELLTSLSNHFYNILKTSPNKDTRDNSSVPVPLLKKIVSSHLNSNFLNSKTSRAHQVSSPRMKDKEQMSAKLDKENKLRKISHTMLETMVNKYECNDFSILLKFDNYHYLRDCIYSMESGKFLVLSTLLSQCSDFEGELWDVCYSYILHLYRLNFPIFLNTTVTQNLTHIMSKVLSKSELYQAAAEGNGSEVDSVKLTLELLDKELVVVKKLEYYFKLVGFRSSENIILFNGILSYLHTLLSHLLITQVGKDKNDKCVLGKKMIKKLIYRYQIGFGVFLTFSQHLKGIKYTQKR